MTYKEFLERFPDEGEILDYFIRIRYPKGIKCPHCGSEKLTRYKNPKFFQCRQCNRSFSVLTGTIFEKTRTDLTSWIYAIHLFLNAKKGISAKQLQREIGVTYKTAWRMLKQIRKAMGNGDKKFYYEAILEIDETYIGGKPRKDNIRNNDDDDDIDKQIRKRKHTGRGTNKTPIVGVVNRDDNCLFAKVAMPDEEGKKLTGMQLLRILIDIANDDDSNVVISDEFRSYNILKKTRYRHFAIDHKHMFGFGDIHTNSVESFWAICKRAIYGIYHQVSVKYLQNYIDEFSFRWNSRNEIEGFDLILKNAILV